MLSLRLGRPPPPPPTVIKEGFLMKGPTGLLAKVKGWEKKYFKFYLVGSTPFLEHFKSEEDSRISTGVRIQLNGISKVVTKIIGAKQKHEFTLILQDRQVELSARSRAEKMAWSEVLMKTLSEIGCLHGFEDNVYEEQKPMSRLQQVAQQQRMEEPAAALSGMATGGVATNSHSHQLPRGGPLRPVSLDSPGACPTATFDDDSSEEGAPPPLPVRAHSCKARSTPSNYTPLPTPTRRSTHTAKHSHSRSSPPRALNYTEVYHCPSDSPPPPPPPSQPPPSKVQYTEIVPITRPSPPPLPPPMDSDPEEGEVPVSVGRRRGELLDEPIHDRLSPSLQRRLMQQRLDQQRKDRKLRMHRSSDRQPSNDRQSSNDRQQPPDQTNPTTSALQEPTAVHSSQSTPGGSQSTPGGSQSTPGGSQSTPGGSQSTPGGIFIQNNHFRMDSDEGQPEKLTTSFPVTVNLFSQNHSKSDSHSDNGSHDDCSSLGDRGSNGSHDGPREEPPALPPKRTVFPVTVEALSRPQPPLTKQTHIDHQESSPPPLESPPLPQTHVDHQESSPPPLELPPLPQREEAPGDAIELAEVNPGSLGPICDGLRRAAENPEGHDSGIESPFNSNRMPALGSNSAEALHSGAGDAVSAPTAQASHTDSLTPKQPSTAAQKLFSLECSDNDHAVPRAAVTPPASEVTPPASSGVIHLVSSAPALVSSKQSDSNVTYSRLRKNYSEEAAPCLNQAVVRLRKHASEEDASHRQSSPSSSRGSNSQRQSSSGANRGSNRGSLVITCANGVRISAISDSDGDEEPATGAVPNYTNYNEPVTGAVPNYTNYNVRTLQPPSASTPPKVDRKPVPVPRRMNANPAEDYLPAAVIEARERERQNSLQSAASHCRNLGDHPSPSGNHGDLKVVDALTEMEGELTEPVEGLPLYPSGDRNTQHTDGAAGKGQEQAKVTRRPKKASRREMRSKHMSTPAVAMDTLDARSSPYKPLHGGTLHQDGVTYRLPAKRSSFPVSVPLRQMQTEELKQQMEHRSGVMVSMWKQEALNNVAFVDIMGCIWVAGWKQSDNPLLQTFLHVGDQVVSLNGEPLPTTAKLHRRIKKSSYNTKLSFVLRRTPHARIFNISRDSPDIPLGLTCTDSAEVIRVHPGGLAQTQGLQPKTITMSGNALCNWVLTEINHRPLSLLCEGEEVRKRLSAVGQDISFMVQPKDFTDSLKKQLKSFKSYRSYLMP